MRILLEELEDGRWDLWRLKRLANGVQEKSWLRTVARGSLPKAVAELLTELGPTLAVGHAGRAKGVGG